MIKNQGVRLLRRKEDRSTLGIRVEALIDRVLLKKVYTNMIPACLTNSLEFTLKRTALKIKSRDRCRSKKQKNYLRILKMSLLNHSCSTKKS